MRIISLLLVSSAFAAQIKVGPNVQVSVAHPNDAHYEVYAAADLKDPSRLVAASFLFPQDGGVAQTVVYASRDGGLSWKPTLQGKQLDNSGDPALAYGPDGTVYYAASQIPSSGPRIMLFYRSKDGGATWDPRDILTYTDREYIAVDATGGKHNGRVYVNGNNRIPPGVSDMVIFYSDDQGRHFAGPGKRPGFGQFTASEIGNIVVASDGTVIGLLSQNRKLHAIRSVDGGASFTPAIPFADFVAGGNRKGAHNNVNSLPALAIDSSRGPYRDRLYAVWPDRRAGRSQIYFARSADGGKSWTTERAINDNPASDTTDQSMPAVAVNRDGVVGVIWSDRRHHPDNLGWDMRFTASLDGGETFAPSVQISEGGTSFDANTPWFPLRPATQTGLNLQVSLSNFLFIGGDTWGLTADANGAFHPVWVDSRGGVPQMWTAAVTVAPGEMTDVSKHMGIELTEPQMDRKTGILTATVRLVNTSDAAVRGPFVVRFQEIRSQLADVAADEEEWRFQAPELAAGGVSSARQVRFRLTNFRPFWDQDRARFGLLEVKASVWAPGVIPRN
jgi:hypothetical protein